MIAACANPAVRFLRSSDDWLAVMAIAVRSLLHNSAGATHPGPRPSRYLANRRANP